MLILCAGVQRTGSTLLYNIARLAFPGCRAAWINDWTPGEGVNVVKLHHRGEALARRASKVLTTRRDLRDVAASCIPRWVPEKRIIDPYLVNWTKRHEWWNSRSGLELDYSTLTESLPSAIEQVKAALGSAEPTDSILAGLAALEEPERPGYDPQNLLHKGHKQDGRTGYYREKLSPELVARLEAMFGGWLRRWGYA